jgi:hypothetical protein
LNYQEEVAAAPYKPSTVENDLSKTDSALKLKAKGTSFKDIFRHWRWHESSFKSFVGVYGYMNILAPRVYYQLMTLLYVAFGCWFFVSLIRRKQREDIIQALIFLFGFSLTIFISAYLSWSYAFQAQGRYLFPIIAMACLLVYSNRRHLNNSIFTLLSAAHS